MKVLKFKNKDKAITLNYKLYSGISANSIHQKIT